MTLARIALLPLALALTAGAARADVLQQRNIPSAVAVDLAQAAVNACAAKNFAVTATVVDRSGVVRAVIGADRAGPHTVEASRAKAFTSASARAATAAMADNAANNAGARNLVYIPGFLLVAGGVPVKSGEEVIGAIGVGGAPGGNLDEECANAGLQAVADRLR